MDWDTLKALVPLFDKDGASPFSNEDFHLVTETFLW